MFFLYIVKIFILYHTFYQPKATSTDVEAPKCFTFSLTLSFWLLIIYEIRHKMSPHELLWRGQEHWQKMDHNSLMT